MSKLCSLLPWALLALTACGTPLRARRLLGPDHYVVPDSPTGRHATVEITSGWAAEAAVPYRPEVAFVHEGVRWIRPVVLTDLGWIRIDPASEAVQLRIFVRSTGLDRGGFRQLHATSGTLGGRLPTTIRYLPSGPLGDAPLRLDVADLQNVYAGERLRHGDLLLLQIGPPGVEPERYLFRTREFGLHTRTGAGLLVRVPLPGTPSHAPPSPALTLSMAVGYRYRSRSPLWEFLGERVRLVGSVGVGATVLDDVEGPLDEQLQGVFGAMLVGGGIELFESVSVQILANASAPFRADLSADWTLAAGFDAVQFGRFFADAGARLLREHPLSQDR